MIKLNLSEAFLGYQWSVITTPSLYEAEIGHYIRQKNSRQSKTSL
jgi:hypothetical protein